MTSVKCNYEKAWKEFKRYFGIQVIYVPDKEGCRTGREIDSIMDEIEQKYMNIIDIRRRSNEEVAGFFMRKFMNLFAKYLNLKNRLEKLGQKGMDEKIEISYFRYELAQICQSIKRDIEECK